MTKTGYSAVNVVTGYMKIALTYKTHCITTVAVGQSLFVFHLAYLQSSAFSLISSS